MSNINFFKILLNLYDSFIEGCDNFPQISPNICELSNHLATIFLILIKIENSIIFKIIQDQECDANYSIE